MLGVTECFVMIKVAHDVFMNDVFNDFAAHWCSRPLTTKFHWYARFLQFHMFPTVWSFTTTIGLPEFYIRVRLKVTYMWRKIQEAQSNYLLRTARLLMRQDMPLHGNNARGAKYTVYYASVVTHTVFENIKWLHLRCVRIKKGPVASLACLFPGCRLWKWKRPVVGWVSHSYLSDKSEAWKKLLRYKHGTQCNICKRTICWCSLIVESEVHCNLWFFEPCFGASPVWCCARAPPLLWKRV